MSNDVKRPQDDSRPMGQPNRENERERSGRSGNQDSERQRTSRPGDSDSDRLDQNTGQPGQSGSRKPSDTDRSDTDNE